MRLVYHVFSAMASGATSARRFCGACAKPRFFRGAGTGYHAQMSWVGCAILVAVVLFVQRTIAASRRLKEANARGDEPPAHAPARGPNKKRKKRSPSSPTPIATTDAAIRDAARATDYFANTTFRLDGHETSYLEAMGEEMRAEAEREFESEAARSHPHHALVHVLTLAQREAYALPAAMPHIEVYL